MERERETDRQTDRVRVSERERDCYNVTKCKLQIALRSSFGDVDTSDTTPTTTETTTTETETIRGGPGEGRAMGGPLLSG